MVDIHKIMEFLPHRYPFLLVDRILEVGEGRIVGLKNVTINEPFFQGHFPGEPVMPGSCLRGNGASCGDDDSPSPRYAGHGNLFDRGR